MATIKSRNTKPELDVRRILFRLGYRFRVNYKWLPGKPDICFTRKRKVIFVNGCFWHGHTCKLGRVPKSNIDFWKHKIETNQARDSEVTKQLIESGWGQLTVWECEIGKKDTLIRCLRSFLGDPKTPSRSRLHQLS